MVFPPPAAPEGQASASWLSELRRWLHLGRKGVIVLVRDAQPARLRELVELMEELEPGFRFTIRASDIMECDPGALMLLPLREQDFDWLNINRPLFAQRRLRVVLWADAAASDTFRFKAPDLRDWVSHFVRCPPGVPRFALEGLRVGLKWWPGVAWHGERLDMALEHAGTRELIELDPAARFQDLVTRLSTARSSPVRWVNVTTGRKLWRVRWSLARAGHHGPNILDNPGISCPGWLDVDARQRSIADALEALQHAGLADAGKVAARLELEPGRLDDLSAPSPPPDATRPHDDVVQRVALLLAPPHDQRALHDTIAVREARRELVKIMRHAPNSRTWTRAELGVFASLERNRRKWPSWHDVAMYRWEVEHLLHTGCSDERRRHAILDFFFLIEERDIGCFLAEEWMQEPRISEGIRARDAWLERAAQSSTDAPTSLALEPLEHQLKKLKNLMKLADALGWDASSVQRTFAQLLRQLVVHGDHEPLLTSIDDALDAASLQLGSEDPGHAMLSRIAGVALGAAGLFQHAFGRLHHAWELLHGYAAVRDELAAELALVLVWLGRFVEAIEMFERVPTMDEVVRRAHRYASRAASAPIRVGLTERKPYDPSIDAARYFDRRLLEIVSRPAAH